MMICLKVLICHFETTDLGLKDLYKLGVDYLLNTRIN